MLTKYPSISVLINYYNKGMYLDECVRSVINQKWKGDIRVLIWNDNSDKSNRNDLYRIYEKYKDKINIRIFSTATELNIKCEKAVPLGVTRWCLVKKALSDYVAFLDADDVWMQEKLYRQMHLFEKNKNLGIVFSDCNYVLNKTILPGTFHDKYKPGKADFFRLLLKYNFMPFSTVIFDKKKLLDVMGAPSHYTSGEDYDWLLKVSAKYDCDYINAPLVWYRILDDSITHNNIGSKRATFYEIDAFINAFKYRRLNKIQYLLWYKRLIVLYMKLIYKQFIRESHRR